MAGVSKAASPVSTKAWLWSVKPTEKLGATACAWIPATVHWEEQTGASLEAGWPVSLGDLAKLQGSKRPYHGKKVEGTQVLT